jgi:hypothetical protein
MQRILKRFSAWVALQVIKCHRGMMSHERAKATKLAKHCHAACRPNGLAACRRHLAEDRFDNVMNDSAA